VRLKKSVFEQCGGGGFVILFCFVLSLSGCVFLVSGSWALVFVYKRVSFGRRQWIEILLKLLGCFGIFTLAKIASDVFSNSIELTYICATSQIPGTLIR
jgi:hypothetical protein